MPTPLYGSVGVTGLARPLLLPQTPIGGVGGRTNVRCHFPKPSEKRRIKRHGWEKRMSSFNGREILRRRILKGRHVLSH
ncbi:large ribosomal subunit protein bL34m-like [Scylla paramamosain]